MSLEVADSGPRSSAGHCSIRERPNSCQPSVSRSVAEIVGAFGVPNSDSISALHRVIDGSSALGRSDRQIVIESSPPAPDPTVVDPLTQRVLCVGRAWAVRCWIDGQRWATSIFLSVEFIYSREALFYNWKFQ